MQPKIRLKLGLVTLFMDVTLTPTINGVVVVVGSFQEEHKHGVR